jgi:hypothetical protein
VNYKKITYGLAGVLLVYFIVAATTLAVSSQHVGWDAGLTLKMTDNGYKHIPFNNYAHPNPKKISEDQYEFVTWWSPGQFAVPFIIEKLFHLKLATALKILTFFCLLISASGIFRLFKTLIPTENIVEDNGRLTAVGLALLLFTVAQPFFWGNLDLYDGGGIMMLAYCPWFIYFVVRYGQINIYTFLLMLLTGLAGFFLKSAFTSIFAGALLYFVLSKSILPFKTFKNLDFKKIARIGIYAAAIFIIYIFIIKVAFLSHNRGISESSQGIRLQPRVLFYPLVAPVLGLFSLSFLNKTYEWIIASVAIIPIYFIVLRSKAISITYKAVLVSFLLTSICFYLFLYLLNLDVSYELRHYVMLSILITPAMFLVLWKYGTLRYFLFGLLGVYFVMNSFNYAENLAIVSKIKQPVYSFSGLPSRYSPGFLKAIDSLDNLGRSGKDIFCFSDDDPSIGLEVRNNRVLLDQNFLNFHFDNRLRFERVLYWGLNSGRVYVVCSGQNLEGELTDYATKFEKYKTFDKIYQNDGYAIFEAIAPGQDKIEVAK